MESEPRVFPLAEIHKTCGALHFIFALASSARGGSDSRIRYLSHREVLFFLLNPFRGSEPSKLEMALVKQ